MKTIIVSDIHGSRSGAEAVAAAIAREQPQRILLLGDLLSPGMPPEDKIQLANILNRFAAQILCVRGNCDQEEWQDYFQFPILDDKKLFYQGERLIFLTHGHLYGEATPPSLLKAGDMLLAGHTHIPKYAVHSSFVYANPGSIAQPRGGSLCSYLLWQGDMLTWKTRDGQAYRLYQLPTQRE